MSGAIRTTRWIIRFLSLGAAIFLLIGGPLPIMFQGLLPALSPLARISAIISGREWYPALFWGLPALFFTVLALWRGRLFCRWFCPTGLAAELARPVSLRRSLVKRRYAGIIFWTVLVSSIFGFPLAMLVDPLVAFARLGHIGHGTYSLLSLIPGVLVPVCLIAGFFQPSVWCTNFCPLGYFFHLCRITTTQPAFSARNGYAARLLCTILH